MCLVHHRKSLATVFRARTLTFFELPSCPPAALAFPVHGWQLQRLDCEPTYLPEWPRDALEGPKDGAPFSFSVLQEQFKFVYDTLEEYVVCGTSFFYVQELSERLKAKSLKDKQTKKHPNEYEKEYSVSHRRFACSLITKPPETGGSPDPTVFFLKNPSAKLDSCFASSCVIIVIAPLGNCQLLSEAVYTATQCWIGVITIWREAIDKWSMSAAESLFGNISYICLLAVWPAAIWDLQHI